MSSDPPKIEANEDGKIKLYCVYLETIERTSTKRIQTNYLFISLTVALLGFLSFTFHTDVSTKIFDMILIFGTYLCLIWFCLIQYYRRLNQVKFKILKELEQDLPYPLFKKEDEIFGKFVLTSSVFEDIIPLSSFLMLLLSWSVARRSVFVSRSVWENFLQEVGDGSLLSILALILILLTLTIILRFFIFDFDDR